MRTATSMLLGIALVVSSVGGCPGVTIEFPGGSVTVPGFGNVTVRVVNDTDFPVNPHIRFDDDSGFFAGLVPAEDLATGLVAPGEALEFNFECSKIGTVLSDDAEQILPGDQLAEADDSATLERDEDYECGAVIEFLFIGNGDAFGVVTSINGVVVD